MATPDDLTALIARCECDDSDHQNSALEGDVKNARYYRRPARTVAAAPIECGKAALLKATGKGTAEASAHGGWAGPGAKKGAQLLSLTTSDHRYVSSDVWRYRCGHR